MNAGTLIPGDKVAEAAQTPESLDLAHFLANLFQEQLGLTPGNRYLLEHGRPACIANHVRTFHWYLPYLPEQGVVLDWGCQHAPDSCLLQARCPDRFELHGCDFPVAGTFQAFHDFAGIQYKQLQDDAHLPFASNSFDVVIGSGVLEHAARDYECLKELYRILKPNGLLVVSYLPNWLSIKEWRRRTFGNHDFHRRLYGMSEAKQLLKRSGFYPIASRYHTFFWERVVSAVGLGRWRRGLSAVAGTLLPVQVFSSTLGFLARKVLWM